MDVAARRFTWFYARCLLKLKYRYTSLGVLWNFLEPAFFLIVLSVVFSVVNRMDLQDYAVFLFAALVPWRYFEKAVNTCMDSIVAGDWLLKKLCVSPLTLPLTRWIIASVEFLISLFVMFVLFTFLKEKWSIHVIVLPVSIIVWAFLGLGVGLISSVLFTFFRDIRPVVQMTLLLVFFCSPILFSAQVFPEYSLQAHLIRLHPITYFAALFQKPIYYAQWPASMDWFVSVVTSAIVLWFGFVLLNKYRGRFYFYI